MSHLLTTLTLHHTFTVPLHSKALAIRGDQLEECGTLFVL